MEETINYEKLFIEDTHRCKTSIKGGQQLMEDHQWKIPMDGRQPSIGYNHRWKTTTEEEKKFYLLSMKED